MEKKVLDDTATFECSNGIGVSFKVTTCQGIAKGKGKRFLNFNTKCSLVSTGQCKMQPNPSGAGFLPCSMASIPATAWQEADSVIKIKGANALIDKSYTMCPIFGGKISIKGSCNNVFNAGCVLAISEIIVKIAEQSKENSSNNVTKRILNSDNGISKIKTVKKDDSVKKDEEPISQESINSEYANCPYEQCEERDTCPYFNAKAEVDNDSSELKKNFEKDRNLEDQQYKQQHIDARKEYPDYSWSFAGHHIISGNQVFMDKDKQSKKLRYGHLLMLASMCGFDINNAMNCILLPTIVSQEGAWGSLEKYLKSATAFDVMDIMKRQWHVGGHAYTVPKDSLKYYKPSDEQVLRSGSNEYFPNYATSVKTKLDKLNDRYARKRCWKKLNTEAFREKFKGQMNEISSEVEKYLLSFERRPKDSYPFFVSKMAVDYAYDAPKTGKIILIYPKGNNIYASKFRVSRKQKNDYQIVVVQNEELPELLINEEGLHEFVRYCENIMHFWIDSELDYTLPWDFSDDYVNKCKIDGNAIGKYACDRSSQLFAYLDNNEVEYQGQMARIRKRWKEVSS